MPILPATSIPVNRVKRDRDVLGAVESILRARMPADWTCELSVERVERLVTEAVLTVVAPDGSRAQCVVGAGLRLDPRAVSATLGQARAQTVDLFEDPALRAAPLIAARFLSRRTRDALVEQGANYADATGNVRFVLDRPAVFIEASGADRDPLPDERPLRSLKGSAGARVVRALFDTDVPLKLADLGRLSGVSPAQTGRVVDLLDRDAVVQRNARGSIDAVDRTKLIWRWADDYEFAGSNDSALYLEPRTLDKLLERLRDVPFRYAVTGSLAARRVAPYAESRLAMVYVDDLDKAADALNLKRLDTRGNVLLAEPFDPVMFQGVREDDGVSYAALGQVAVDLLTSPGRGPAEGVELLRVLEARRGR